MKGIDFDVISKLEGGQHLVGYVPTNKGQVIGQSGVTIATGVDLGQWSLTDIRKLELPQELVKKIEPYLGRKKESALDALAENQLYISKEEADILDKQIYKQIFLRVEELFNKDGFTKFEDLPNQAQTVIASIATNRGPSFGYLGGLWSTLWIHLLDGQWKKAKTILELIANKDLRLKNRRKEESAILSTLITKELKA